MGAENNVYEWDINLFDTLFIEQSKYCSILNDILNFSDFALVVVSL